MGMVLSQTEKDYLKGNLPDISPQYESKLKYKIGKKMDSLIEDVELVYKNKNEDNRFKWAIEKIKKAID